MNLSKINYQYLIFIVSLLFAAPSIGQTGDENAYKDKDSAKSYIQGLKKGTLVVRLVSGNKKLMALKGLMESETAEAKQREKAEKDYHMLYSQNESYNRELVYAFANMYDFSEVLFMQDTAATSLKAGVTSGIFLDKDLNIDQSITLDNNKPYFILRIGGRKNSDSLNEDSLVLMDADFNDAPKPLPYFSLYKANIAQTFAAFIGSDMDMRRNPVKVVKEMNAKWTKFYARTLAWQG